MDLSPFLYHLRLRHCWHSWCCTRPPPAHTTKSWGTSALQSVSVSPRAEVLNRIGPSTRPSRRKRCRKPLAVLQPGSCVLKDQSSWPNYSKHIYKPHTSLRVPNHWTNFNCVGAIEWLALVLTPPRMNTSLSPPTQNGPQLHGRQYLLLKVEKVCSGMQYPGSNQSNMILEKDVQTLRHLNFCQAALARQCNDGFSWTSS